MSTYHAHAVLGVLLISAILVPVTVAQPRPPVLDCDGDVQCVSAGQCAAPNIPSDRNFQWNCSGNLTSVQTPSPGVWAHVNGELGYMSPQTTCVRDNLNPSSSETIRAIDQIYYNEENFPGDVTFRDSQRVRWINVGNGSIAGNIICQDCTDIEVDGVCYGN